MQMGRPGCRHVQHVLFCQILVLKRTFAAFAAFAAFAHLWALGDEVWSSPPAQEAQEVLVMGEASGVLGELGDFLVT